jgi:hypothetical protein
MNPDQNAPQTPSPETPAAPTPPVTPTPAETPTPRTPEAVPSAVGAVPAKKAGNNKMVMIAVAVVVVLALAAYFLMK